MTTDKTTDKSPTTMNGKSKMAEKNMVAGIDIDKLVKKAQEGYGKKEQGLAQQLTTGKTIFRPTEEKDFIVWPNGDFWKKLTGGMPGLAYNRVTQLSGKPDSAKSSVAMNFMSAAQKQGVLVILWDAERKFSSKRFDNKMGGDSNKLLIVNTNKIVDGAKAVGQFVHAAKEMDPAVKILIVWDSCGSSLSSTESREDNDESISMQPGVAAREVGWAIKKFNKLANQYMDKETGEESIAILVINQTYSSIGGFGPPTQIERGGSELYYLSSIIVQMTRKKDLVRTKNGEKYKYGILSRARLKKFHLGDGDENLTEVDIIASAAGVQLATEVTGVEELVGWGDESEEQAE